jgi:hypothetical protein
MRSPLISMISDIALCGIIASRCWPMLPAADDATAAEASKIPVSEVFGWFHEQEALHQNG